MTEYLRTENTVSFTYNTDEAVTNIIYSVNDPLNGETLEYDELYPDSPGSFLIELTEESSRYDRDLRIDIDLIFPTRYEQDHLYITLVRPFVTVTDINNYFSNTPQAEQYDAVNPEYLVILEKKVRYLIQSITNDQFKFEYKTVGAYGSNTDLLHLGQRIESFDKITYNDYVTYDSTEEQVIDELGVSLAVAPSRYAIKVIAPGVNIAEWADQNPLSNSGYFKKDSAYLIRGEYGWRSIPEDIKVAAYELINDELCADSIYANKGIKSIQNDSFNLQFADTVGASTGNLYVDALLAPYKAWNLRAI